jgi:molybdenum cofactor guanylyltransferase
VIAPANITGLVLAGGRGSRMGGVDKGLQNHRGMPLALHALLRLQPQVGHLVINANRNLGAYEALGAPVLLDAIGDFQGPLVGFLAGLASADTGWLMTVPCDTPDFPTDLVARLAQAAGEHDAEIAYATTLEDGIEQRQPVFCLLQVALHDSLAAFLDGGGRKIDAWFARHRAVGVPFPDPAAFFNANTAEELARLQR